MFAEFKQKALGFPLTLTGSERRRLLDLPEADDEAANIVRLSARSRNDGWMDEVHLASSARVLGPWSRSHIPPTTAGDFMSYTSTSYA